MIELASTAPPIDGKSNESGFLTAVLETDNEISVSILDGSRRIQKRFPFYPFFFVTSAVYLENFPRHHWLKQLKGSGQFQILVVFRRWSDFWEAIRLVLKRRGIEQGRIIEHVSDCDVLYVRTDPVTQFLLTTGYVLLKGVEFNSLRRLQLIVIPETVRPSEPEISQVPIKSIAVSTSDGKFKQFSFRDEKKILERLNDYIRSFDPDFIEGHFLSDAILPYLEQRALALNYELQWGPNSEAVRKETVPLEKNFRSVPLYACTGRSFIDTSLLIAHPSQTDQIRDAFKPHIASFSRLNTPGSLSSDADAILEECRKISQIVDACIEPFLELTRHIPLTLRQILNTNTDVWLDLIILREAIRERLSLDRSGPHLLGHSLDSELYGSGDIGSAFIIDSTLLSARLIADAQGEIQSSSQRIFVDAINQCLARRRTAENLARTAAEPSIRRASEYESSAWSMILAGVPDYLYASDTLLSGDSFRHSLELKIAEFDRAVAVALHQLGVGEFVSRDVEHIYFAVSDMAVDPSISTTKEFMAKLQAIVPETEDFNTVVPVKRMIVFRKKNYCYINFQHELFLIGTGIIPKNTELCFTNFFKDILQLLLMNKFQEIRSHFITLFSALHDRQLSLKDISKAEILRDSLETYLREKESGKRPSHPAYEAAITLDREIHSGTVISYYICGEDGEGGFISKPSEMWNERAPDYDVRYYEHLLSDLIERLSVVLTKPDREVLFPDEEHFAEDPTDDRLRSIKLRGRLFSETRLSENIL